MTTPSRDRCSFGDLLKGWRIRRSLTQHQLATAVGVHRNAIGRWELGDVLPASKTMVLELARHLALSDTETRQFLEASLTALSPHWYVPMPRNLFFTGREAILETLHAQLGIDQAVALTRSSALHGLGGVGKTQIALEYAYRHALEYRAVFWIGAETTEQIVSSFLRIAEVLGLPEQEETDRSRVVAAVQRWLTTHGRWLLIWDNLEELAVLERFLPATRSGALLLTTRCQVLGTSAWGLALGPMEPEEGLLFLLRRAKVLAGDATGNQLRQFVSERSVEYAVAEEVVRELGGLPLALDQAGAYLEAMQCGLPTYLDLLRTQRAALLGQRGLGVREHPASVSTTFALAVTATAQRHPAGRDLLRVCALLHSDAIPEELFRQGGEHLGTILAAICCGALEWNQVVAAACAYSLLSKQPAEHTFSLHRLVQAVLLDTMTPTEREQWNMRAIRALEAVFPDVLEHPESGIWESCERLLPHALLCLQRARTAEPSLPLASLSYKTAQYLCHHHGAYAQAEPLYLRALQIQEQVLGPDHPDVARVLNALAILYRSQGRYGEAEPLYRRALSIRELALGPDHLEVAASLNSLAILTWEQARYAEAEPLYLRALSIREQALGPDHPRVAQVLDNVALLYWSQGKDGEAEALYRRVIIIRERGQGSAHPDLARTLNNLAILYRRQGRYTEAEPLYRRALHIQEQALGPEHIRVISLLGNLAECRTDQRRYVEAGQLYQQAAHLGERVLGPEHPLMAELLNGWAILSREQGKDAEAEALFGRALTIREQHLGRHHPETAQTLHDLALLRQQQGRHCEASALAERALSIRLQALGDKHPNTVATQTLAKHLLQAQAHARQEALGRQETTQQDCYREVGLAKHSSPPSQEPVDPVPSQIDFFQLFLAACCELHPRAWCRSADLWQAYLCWVEDQQERFPISRGAFIAQLKAHGCRADRTKTARIWRGIALANKAR